MGSSSAKPSETDYIEQIKSINENELDLNKTDTLQMKAIKQLVKRIEFANTRRDDIRSPTSSAHALRLLPAMFLMDRDICDGKLGYQRRLPTGRSAKGTAGLGRFGC